MRGPSLRSTAGARRNGTGSSTRAGHCTDSVRLQTREERAGRTPREAETDLSGRGRARKERIRRAARGPGPRRRRGGEEAARRGSEMPRTLPWSPSMRSTNQPPNPSRAKRRRRGGARRWRRRRRSGVGGGAEAYDRGAHLEDLPAVRDVDHAVAGEQAALAAPHALPAGDGLLGCAWLAVGLAVESSIESQPMTRPSFSSCHHARLRGASARQSSLGLSAVTALLVHTADDHLGIEPGTAEQGEAGRRGGGEYLGHTDLA